MRKLVTSDLFAAMRLANHIGLKEIVKLARDIDIKDTDAIANVGATAIVQLFASITSKEIESEIYEFLAGIFEITVQEVASLPLSDLKSYLVCLCKENNILDFFSSVSKLTITK